MARTIATDSEPSPGGIIPMTVDNIKQFQHMLNRVNKNTALTVDGDFGNKTFTAATNLLKTITDT